MASQLEAYLRGLAVLVRIVDIDADTELKARFNWDVPLLFEDQLEICRHEFDLMAFETWLNIQPTDI